MQTQRRMSHVIASGVRRGLVLAHVFAVLFLAAGQASAQGRDGLLNGVVIGAGVGAGTGVAFTHAVRDSDLTFGQYARGALIFGAIGAGAGIGIDALLSRTTPLSRGALQRLSIAPSVWRRVSGVVVQWRW